MSKKSNLTPEQRSQLVLRVLAKEEPTVKIARSGRDLGSGNEHDGHEPAA